MQKVQHPIVGLWPYPTVNRYFNFFSLFRAKRNQLFAMYEQQDGEYHGPEQYGAPSAAAKSASAETVHGDAESEEDFDDSEFV